MKEKLGGQQPLTDTPFLILYCQISYRLSSLESPFNLLNMPLTVEVPWHKCAPQNQGLPHTSVKSMGYIN